MAFSMFYIIGTFSMFVFLQSANGEQTEKFTFIKQIGKFLGTAQYVVSGTEGRHCGPPKNLSEKKNDKNEVINNSDNNTERIKSWSFLKRFLHDKTKIFYQEKPRLGKM